MYFFQIRCRMFIHQSHFHVKNVVTYFQEKIACTIIEDFNVAKNLVLIALTVIIEQNMLRMYGLT